jgi:hypothetical protein
MTVRFLLIPRMLALKYAKALALIIGRDLRMRQGFYSRRSRYLLALRLVNAFLGRKVEAIREGNQAVSIYPVSKDALAGPDYVSDLARIYVIAGEYESAIDKLDYLMSIPAGDAVSVNSLKKDPTWDPLRDLPRFKQLIEKYSKKN